MSSNQIALVLPDVVQSKIDQYVAGLPVPDAMRHEAEFTIYMVAAQSFIMGFTAERNVGFKAIQAFRAAEDALSNALQLKEPKVDIPPVEDKDRIPQATTEQLAANKKARQDHRRAQEEAAAKQALDFDPSTIDAVTSLGIRTEQLHDMYGQFLEFTQNQFPETPSHLKRLIGDWMQGARIEFLYINLARVEGVASYLKKVCEVMSYHFDVMNSLERKTSADLQAASDAAHDELDNQMAEIREAVKEELQQAAKPEVVEVSKASPVETPKLQGSVANLAANVEAAPKALEQVSDPVPRNGGYEDDLRKFNEAHEGVILDAVRSLSKTGIQLEDILSIEEIARASKPILSLKFPAAIPFLKTLSRGNDVFIYLTERARQTVIAEQRLDKQKLHATEEAATKPRRGGRSRRVDPNSEQK